ncbi:hypothetical protein [Aquimarina sp. AU474]|uniref:hypothetical protein n=1 Tax=Aquimarina sp. AU474 TaxID=2108529 RepID=UPI000D68E57B|nr:hypothetical protein [Aquimarina sp. AU474]
MKNNYKIFVGLLFILFLNIKFSLVYSQSVSDKEVYYQWFDDSVKKENTSLYNGTVFVNRYRVIGEKHRFFTTNDFLTGTISYDGQKYYNLPIQYDVYQDELIVKLKQGYREVPLQLIKSKVHSFVINNTPFVNIVNDSLAQNNRDGFYEVLLKTPTLSLLKKYNKGRRKRIKNGQAFYEFAASSDHILFYNQKYFDVGSKKEVIEVFPQFKDDINSFSSTSKKLKKADPDAYKKSLFKKIHGLISNANNL